MRLLPSLFYLLVILHYSFAPPVTPDKSKEQDSDVKDNLEEYMEYHRYLKEVVQTLESDPEFRERLEKADENDVRSGKIAEQLDFVNHNVRTKLDEIKRRELERLRHLATKQFELDNNLDVDKVPNEHLDHANPHTFEIEDLKKLIQKTTSDLEAADKQRQQQFKEYEMEKEFEKHQKTEKMDEKQKQEFLEKEKEKENAKKPHQPIHHPGSKPQLEEVWEKQDHMDQQFDPKTFFMMHDVDGNGVWDADEVKALFIKELDKIYGPNGPNPDLHERAEEMERMREHVFKENDHNRDGLIDLHEFMMETQKANFNNDEGWKSIDENQIYSQSEYEEFEKRRLEEIRYLQEHGLIDAQGRPIPGSQHKLQQYYQLKALQEQQHRLQQGQQQYYPQGQMPQGQPPHQGYQGQVPPQGYQQMPNQGYQQMPNQGYQAHPQGQFQGQQPPQGQLQGQQPPQGQFQGLQPPQGQFQGQQLPQGQFQGQQPPQGQFQGQQQPQGQIPQGQFQQPPQGQFQQPPQGQFQQPPQAQQVSQDHFQAQQPQAQLGGQGQIPNQQTQNRGDTQQAQPAVAQGQAPPQGQPTLVQGQQGAGQGQVPPANAQAPPAKVGAN